MAKSVKHHFVPVGMLDGFSNAQGKIVVYDKCDDRFHHNQDPRNWFFVKHLNRIRLPNGTEHEWEGTWLSDLDGRHGALLNALRDRPVGQALESMSTIERIDLLWFAMILYWRHPDAGGEFLELFEQIGAQSDYFSFGDEFDFAGLVEAGGESRLHEFLSNPEWQKLSKFFVPFSKGMMRDLRYHLENFRIYPVDYVDDWFFVCGDRPLATLRSSEPSKRLFDGYLLPLSSKRMLLVTKQSAAFLDATLMAQVNVNLIHQAYRYVACCDYRFLKFMVSKYKDLTMKGHSAQLSKAMFDHLAWQASFESYDAYAKAFDEKIGRFETPVF